jgi:hypothetical protein
MIDIIIINYSMSLENLTNFFRKFSVSFGWVLRHACTKCTRIVYIVQGRITVKLKHALSNIADIQFIHVSKR